MSTKIILRADVSGVGKRGDIVDVADGYARNFLLPRGKAIKASAGSVQQANAMRRARDLRDAKDRAAAETIARELVPKTFVITAKARDGKLFGSVASAQVVAAVRDQAHVQLDAKHVQLHEHIKTVGTHSVPVRLHNDVQFALTVEVQPA